MNNKRTVISLPTGEDACFVMIAAFRYAPSIIANWIYDQRGSIPDSDLELIVREIDEADDRQSIGMVMDAHTWRWLKKQLSRELSRSTR